MSHWQVDLYIGHYSELYKRQDELSILLSEDEKARAARFISNTVRDRFIIGRGFLRKTLARYTQTPIRFIYGVRNKPYVKGVSFNLSHSQDVLLLAVTRGEVALGVDVEAIRPMKEMETVARDNFSDWEYQQWSTLPQSTRTKAFYTCWTRKEAYIKAVGDGFALPLDAFDVSVLPDDDPPDILRADGDDPHRWRLYHLEPEAGYVGALCIAGEAEISVPFD
ncbi:MAG: 4'-phosphopantetheinyl transferase [Phototrophicales bacterium]|nr:MAG: 4'-phosphopantetheinyl transferase [Phototrophicales bacterium]